MNHTIAAKDEIDYALELKPTTDSSLSDFSFKATELSPSSSFGLLPVLSHGPVVERPTKLWDPRTYSRSTWALLCNQLTFFVLGVYDSGSSASSTAWMQHYHIDAAAVSTLFLINIFGYLAGCLISPLIIQHAGAGVLTCVAALFMILGTFFVAALLPLPAFYISQIATGLGSGVFNVLMSTLAVDLDQTRGLSFLWAAYSLGCSTGPMIVAGLLVKETPFQLFYFIPACGSVVLLPWQYYSAKLYKTPPPAAAIESTEPTTIASNAAGNPLIAVLRMPLTYLGFMLAVLNFSNTYLAAQHLVRYLLAEKHASITMSRYLLSAFWLATCIGRLILPPTFAVIKALASRRSAILPRRHITRAISKLFTQEQFYLVVSLLFVIGAVGLLWLLKTAEVGFVAVVLFGFFQGPVLPCSLAIIASYFKVEQRRAVVVGLLTAVGVFGASFIPFVFGLISAKTSLEPFGAVLLVTSFLTIVCLLVLPREADADEEVVEYPKEVV